MAARAALGFRAHSGWAAAVALGGPIDRPTVIDRRRVELVDANDPHAKQPYHAAAELELEEAEKLLAQCLKASTMIARSGFRTLIADLRKHGYGVCACGVLQGSGRPLPELAKILGSHPLLHTAEGILFRDVLARASDHCKIPVTEVRERELFLQATARLHVSPGELKRRLAELGKPLGPPWGQDEKFAALIAWLALASVL